MSPRSWEFRIADIISAVQNVLTYTAGMTYADFTADRKSMIFPPTRPIPLRPRCFKPLPGEKTTVLFHAAN
jgi:hypothetical protein